MVDHGEDRLVSAFREVGHERGGRAVEPVVLVEQIEGDSGVEEDLGAAAIAVDPVGDLLGRRRFFGQKGEQVEFGSRAEDAGGHEGLGHFEKGFASRVWGGHREHYLFHGCGISQA